MSRTMRLAALAIVCTAALAVTAPAAFAGNPPSGAERIIGPPIEGVFVAYIDVFDFNENGTIDEGETTLIGKFVGACKDNQNGKVPVGFWIYEPSYGTPASFATLTEIDLMDYREGLAGAGPPGCFSDSGGEDLIVTGVQKFNNWSKPGFFFSPMLGAEIQLSVVEAK